VLSLPHRLRDVLAWNHDLCRAVVGVYLRRMSPMCSRLSNRA